MMDDTLGYAYLPSEIYHHKYKNLKRKLKTLIYENECFMEELKKAQRKFLKVSCDKSFLLDRLMRYESVGSSSSDSEATESSESDADLKSELMVAKKKRLSSSLDTTDACLVANTSNDSLRLSDVKKKKTRKLPRPKVSNARQTIQKGNAGTASSSVCQVSAEKLERHVDSKQSLLHLIPEKTPLTLPVEIFSSETSALDCDLNDGEANESSPNMARAMSEDDGLIIDFCD